MRELDHKEDVIKSVQDRADRLMQKSHPARLTIEVSPFIRCERVPTLHSHTDSKPVKVLQSYNCPAIIPG